MQKVYQSYGLAIRSPSPPLTIPPGIPALLTWLLPLVGGGKKTQLWGSKGKMQIFVKYMRVKIVVLHYPFNWIWASTCGTWAKANTKYQEPSAKQKQQQEQKQKQEQMTASLFQRSQLEGVFRSLALSLSLSRSECVCVCEICSAGIGTVKTGARLSK